MGRLILISGSNNSGKSLFAERLAAGTKGERFYIATMISSTEDNRLRIAKHRRQREGLGFCTLELPFEVKNAPITADSVVLLEDVSNLLANSMFEKIGSIDDVYRDIVGLAGRCRLLFAVTISDLSADGFDEETAYYIDGLNKLNRRLYSFAQTAVTMKDGLPMLEKGDYYDIN